MKPITKQDLIDLKNQITKQSFKPNTVLMSEIEWRWINDPIYRLYYYALKAGEPIEAYPQPDGSIEIHIGAGEVRQVVTIGETSEATHAKTLSLTP